MNILGSWIDSKALEGTARDLTAPRCLADEFASLMSVPAPPQPASLRASDFTGIPEVPTAERQKVREMLEAVKRRAHESGLLKTPPSPPSGSPSPLASCELFTQKSAPPPAQASASSQEVILSKRGLPYFIPPHGPLATRVRAFVDWLKRQIPTEALFIVDAQGCPVSDAEPPADLLASALLLADAARRSARHLPASGEGSLLMDLPENKKLCVIHTETSYGHFCLGLVSAESMPSNTADRLRRALQRTVESDRETGPLKIESPPPS